MERVIKYILRVVACCVLLLSSCIKNDIPYPVIPLEILDIKGEGFTCKSIDTRSGVVTITLDEQTDIRAVEISSVECTEGTTLTNSVVGTFDMRTPLSTTLYLYQNYDWQIVAEQSIEREFKVVGQIGEERIDVAQNRVDVDVNEATVDVTNIEVLSFKLGPADISTYNPTLDQITGTDFTTVRRIDVTAHGRENRWNIYVHPVEASVVLKVDMWGTVAWLSAEGDTSDPAACGFAYRSKPTTKAGDGEWIKIPATTVGNGTFSAKVTGLSPSSEYEFEAYVGDTNSGSLSDVTEEVPALVNGGFEQWQKIGNAWYPYGVDTEEYWGTGNKGSTILSANSNITLPDNTVTAPSSDGEYSTLMSSSAVVGVFAAGNLFTGRFVKIAGTNGIIGMGRPFTQRPLALKGWAKYNQGVVTHSNIDAKKIGDKDTGSIYIALGTWDYKKYGVDADGNVLGDSTTPIIIDTRDKSTFFDSSSSDVIAFGELYFDESSDWSEFKIDLKYRDLKDSAGNVIQSGESRVPTHILIVCSSSRYGDYFTGSTDSKMWIDDFELVYK